MSGEKMKPVSDEPIDYRSNDAIMRLRVIHEYLMEHELKGTAGNLWKVIEQLDDQSRRAVPDDVREAAERINAGSTSIDGGTADALILARHILGVPHD